MICDLLVDQDRYPLSAAAGAAYREAFLADCYVRFPGFFRPDAFADLAAEVERLRQAAVRYDLEMPGSEGTPRYMSTLGGQAIRQGSSLLPLLYADPRLREFLAGVAGEEVLLVPDAVEDFVINFLHRPGDVHGGHVDVYAFTFNVFIEGPQEGQGGALEMVPGSTRVADLDGPGVRRIWHRPGDCYFIRTDQAVHRVSPLTVPVRRSIVSMALANRETVDRRSYSTSLYDGGA